MKVSARTIIVGLFLVCSYSTKALMSSTLMIPIISKGNRTKPKMEKQLLGIFLLLNSPHLYSPSA
jgi:hypothetical protein